MRTEPAAPAVWVGSLVASALLCAVLSLRVDVPSPPAIEIVPGEPAMPAPEPDVIERAVPAVVARDLCRRQIDATIDGMIELQVLAHRAGFMSKDVRYLMADMLRSLEGCLPSSPVSGRVCTGDVAVLLAQRWQVATALSRSDERIQAIQDLAVSCGEPDWPAAGGVGLSRL